VEPLFADDPQQFTVMLGCRTEGGYAIATDDEIDDIRRNCWTASCAFRGTIEECREFIAVRNAEQEAATE